jgi:hypothetical protein
MLPLEVSGCGPGHEKGATKVGIHGPIPDFRREGVKVLKRYGVVPGGIVDENVEATECLNGSLDRGTTSGRVGLVQMYKKTLAAFLLDLATYVEAFIAVPKVSHRDVHPLISKHACRDASESTTPTGNQGDSIA